MRGSLRVISLPGFNGVFRDYFECQIPDLYISHRFHGNKVGLVWSIALIGMDFGITRYWIILNWVFWIDLSRSQCDVECDLGFGWSMVWPRREPFFRWFHKGFLVLLVRLRSDLCRSGGFSHFLGGNQVGGDWVKGLSGQILQICRFWLNFFEILEESYCRSVRLLAQIGKDLGINKLCSILNWFLRVVYFGSQIPLQGMESWFCQSLFRSLRFMKSDGFQLDLILKSDDHEDLLRVIIRSSNFLLHYPWRRWRVMAFLLWVDLIFIHMGFESLSISRIWQLTVHKGRDRVSTEFCLSSILLVSFLSLCLSITLSGFGGFNSHSFLSVSLCLTMSQSSMFGKDTAEKSLGSVVMLYLFRCNGASAFKFNNDDFSVSILVIFFWLDDTKHLVNGKPGPFLWSRFFEGENLVTGPHFLNGPFDQNDKSSKLRPVLVFNRNSVLGFEVTERRWSVWERITRVSLVIGIIRKFIQPSLVIREKLVTKRIFPSTLFLSQHLWRNLQSLGLLWDTFGDSFWCFSSFWFLRNQARVMVSIMSNGSVRNYRPFRILKNWNLVVYKRRTQLPSKPQLSSSSPSNKSSSSFGFIFGFFAKVSLGVFLVFVLLEMSQTSLLGKESVEKSLGAVALSFWGQFTSHFGFNIVATLDPIGFKSDLAILYNSYLTLVLYFWLLVSQLVEHGKIGSLVISIQDPHQGRNYLNIRFNLSILRLEKADLGGQQPLLSKVFL